MIPSQAAEGTQLLLHAHQWLALGSRLLPFALLEQEALGWKCSCLAIFLNGPAHTGLSAWLAGTKIQSPVRSYYQVIT